MEAGLPAKLSGEEDTYLLNVALAHVSYTLGRVKETIAHIDRILRAKYARDEEYLLCVKRYLTLQQNRYDNDRIEAVLACFHKPETIRKLYDFDLSYHSDVGERKPQSRHTACPIW